MQERGRREVVIELIYDYQNPIIPKGFEYLKGEWNNGFTIKSQIDGSEFVWIPVGLLEADGSLDGGQNFGEKFGRRSLWGGKLDRNYEDVIQEDLIDSINKYGGFWISAFVASKEENNIVFKRGALPFCEYTREEAIEAASSYAEKYDSVKSCIPGEAGYDTLFKWIIQTGAKTEDECLKDSTSWGYYSYNFNFYDVLPTGSSEKYCVNNIYDLAGNASEMTGGLCQGYLTIYRGSGFKSWISCFPACSHVYGRACNNYKPKGAFRTLLYME